MDRASIFWTLALCLSIPIWWYYTTDMSIDYERHDSLIDPDTKLPRRPVDVLNLSKIINQTDEYIANTNAQERLYDLEHQLNWENPFIMDQSYSNKRDLQVSGWPVADQDKCGQELRWLLNQLNNIQQNYTLLKGRLGYDLTNWMDSMGKPETGTYSGVVNWLGSHKQCSKLTLNGGKIKARYCIGKLRPSWWPEKETITPKTRIRLGLCLPETCDTLSFDVYKQMIEQLGKFEFNQFYKDNLHMESIFCLPDERSPVRQMPLSGHIFIYVACFWIAVVITATLVNEFLPKIICREYAINRYPQFARLSKQLESITIHKENVKQARPADVSNQDQPKSTISSQILKALSLRSSLKAFKTNSFNVKYNQGHRVRVDLGGLDFFKVVMAVLVVLAHSAYISMVYIRSLSNRIELSTNESGRLVVSVARCVDTFFVFFGVLTSYTLMRKFSTKQLSNPLIWLGVNMGILLRITPIFTLVYWYSKSVSPYTGSGPWWDYGVDRLSLRGGCMQDSSWLRAIPYFGSTGSPRVPACNLPSWFIISYSQISIILPIVTYIICKLPGNLYRCLLILLLSCASALNISYRMYVQETLTAEAFSQYGGFVPDLLEKFQSTGYTSTFGRIGCVSVGCYVGYLLRQYETNKIKQWPNWLRSRPFIGFLALMHLVIVAMPVIGHRLEKYTGGHASMEQIVGVNGFFMIIWPILNSIVIIHATSVSNHTVIVRFFSHSFWHVANRICYCVYLIHWEIIFVGMTSFEEGPTYGFIFDVMKTWSFGLLFAIGISFLIHIAFEAPLSELLTVLARLLTPPKEVEPESSDGTRKEIKVITSHG